MVGIGASLTLKAAIGVGAWDALAQSISFSTGIKVGTIAMILNSSCVLGQLLILRKDFRLKHLLQLPIGIVIGVVVNFIFYDVLGPITVDSYVMNLLLLLVAYIIIAASIAGIMLLDVVTFPLEGICMAIANKMNWKFVVVRQSADVISLVLVLIITFTMAIPLTLREGTVIGMLFFAPLMGFFMKLLEPGFRKLSLLNDQEETIKVTKEPIKAM